MARFSTLWRGIEGQIVLVEGQATDQLTLNDRSQITAYWVDRPMIGPMCLHSKADQWIGGLATSLDIGSVDGMGARVLNYYRRSEPS